MIIFLVAKLQMIMYLTDLEAIKLQVTKKILDLQERKRKYDLSEIWNVIFYIVNIAYQ